MLEKIFTWWSGASLGALFTIRRTSVAVGEDEFGNRYFQARTDRESYDRGRRRRYVIYKGYAEPTKIPPEWHAWMHYLTDEPPTVAPLKRMSWERNHVPNLTGTVYAWRPKGSISRGGERAGAPGDYQAWSPGEVSGGGGSGQAWAETAVGAVVLAVAGAFLAYALGSSLTERAGGGYELVARFGQAGGLAAGADVRVAGVKIGQVTRIELDPKTYLARTRFRIDQGVKLPSDSSVKITSDGLLGGQYVAVQPGGAVEDLKPGGEFENVQGAVDLFGLIGQVIRPQPAAGAPAAAPAPPSAASTLPPVGSGSQ